MRAQWRMGLKRATTPKRGGLFVDQSSRHLNTDSSFALKQYKVGGLFSRLKTRAEGDLWPIVPETHSHARLHRPVSSF